MENYEVLKMIGRGNFGTVHLCRSRKDGKTYVMKRIPMHDMTDVEKQGAQQEVELLKKLKNTFIVAYQDSFVHDDTLHVVMEYCDGGDLRTRIRKADGVHLPEEQILQWFIQIALALEYCHRHKVIHRDLKTQNIFLTRKHVVKLGDFGIARVLAGTSEMAMSVVGTPYSMSPEVCENKPYGFASDVWSLGCVLYELCTLKHAFDADNLLGLVWKIVQDSYPPIPDEYSPELHNLVDGMLKKDPTQRPTLKDIIAMPFIRDHLTKLMNSTRDEKAAIRQSSSTSLHSSTSSHDLIGRPSSVGSVVGVEDGSPQYAGGFPLQSDDPTVIAHRALEYPDAHDRYGDMYRPEADEYARTVRRVPSNEQYQVERPQPAPVLQSREPVYAYEPGRMDNRNGVVPSLSVVTPARTSPETYKSPRDQMNARKMRDADQQYEQRIKDHEATLRSFHEERVQAARRTQQERFGSAQPLSGLRRPPQQISVQGYGYGSGGRDSSPDVSAHADRAPTLSSPYGGNNIHQRNYTEPSPLTPPYNSRDQIRRHSGNSAGAPASPSPSSPDERVIRASGRYNLDSSDAAASVRPTSRYSPPHGVSSPNAGATPAVASSRSQVATRNEYGVAPAPQLSGARSARGYNGPASASTRDQNDGSGSGGRPVRTSSLQNVQANPYDETYSNEPFGDPSTDPELADTVGVAPLHLQAPSASSSRRAVSAGASRYDMGSGSGGANAVHAVVVNGRPSSSRSATSSTGSASPTWEHQQQQHQQGAGYYHTTAPQAKPQLAAMQARILKVLSPEQFGVAYHYYQRHVDDTHIDGRGDLEAELGPLSNDAWNGIFLVEQYVHKEAQLSGR